jgi:hypothetical protein
MARDGYCDRPTASGYLHDLITQRFLGFEHFLLKFL